MKRFKLIKTPAMLAIAASMIALTGCAKKSVENESADLESNKTQRTESLTSGVIVNVKTAGAVGNGTTDDTWAFNKAVDQVAAAGGGNVYVPIGTYLIDADVSIKLKSNVYLDMVDSLRIIKVKPTASNRYNVIRMHGVTNSRVIGGKIKGERYQHLTTTGEHGMGISMYQAVNCKVIDAVITDCWGDGIVVAGSSLYSVPGRSMNCVIYNVKIRNNRRNGVTIGGVDSLIVVNSDITHTNGTLPMAGIDIEPDVSTAERVYLRNNTIAYNTKCGVTMNAKPSTTAIIRKITVEGNYIHHNTYSGYLQHISDVKFYYNRLINNDWNGSAPGGNGNVPYLNDATNTVITPNTYQ